MTPGRLPLVLYRGDTYRWRFSLWEDVSHTVAADLTDVTVSAQLRDAPGGVLVAPLACSVTLPNIIDAVLSAEDCARLPNTSAWDLQLVYASGDVATVLAGPVNTTADVTGSAAGAIGGTPTPLSVSAAYVRPWMRDLTQ